MRETISLWSVALNATAAAREILRSAGEADEIVLTTEHAASSYGLPVVVVAGRAYGPADLGYHEIVIADVPAEGAELPSVEATLDLLSSDWAPARWRSRSAARAAARAAGYTVAGPAE